MAAVKIFTTRFCPFCVRAKQLLDRKGVAYDETAVDGRNDLREDLLKRTGRRTVPQIWVGDTHVGGCDELYTLERSGRLDELLAAD
ncbi:MAG: glutaredoxin 3 [Spongiibacter sp.]|uniref:Glutaredoxin n=1 Tax=Spongiibacter thalassae TaxID=2721624 RepID=A0ABX1GJT5_9GAMM|nr:glutaredoxin 3 [Spongiibacter thalassae]MDX1505844.1 glutaredoxin 3 [Spongiibacter sp.]NKI19215.1 glutaredoxin 3 [Spongiibacter thalassae]